MKSLETMGFTYVPFIPGWEMAAENLSAVPVVAAALGPVAGLGRGPRGRLALLGDRARHGAALRRGAAGGRGRDGGDARQGGAGRGARADARRAPSTTRRRTRTTRSRSCAGSSPTCRRTCGSRRRSCRRDDPRDRREEDLLSIVPRERRKPYKARRILEAVFDRGSVFEVGAHLRAHR